MPADTTELLERARSESAFEHIRHRLSRHSGAARKRNLNYIDRVPMYSSNQE